MKFLEELREAKLTISNIDSSRENEVAEISKLKEEVQIFRSKTQEQCDAYERRNSDQANEITDLQRHLAANQEMIFEKDQSLTTLSQLLAIRTDLISSMQTKEEQLLNQISYANQVVNEKSEDWHKMLTSMLNNDEQLQKQQEQVELIKAELQESQRALDVSEARAAKLVELNGQLKVQFHKIMSYRDLKV